ncbi:MAG: hypothetical protein JXA18_08820 [Chitinispirillaceae bacterium]|nr:hypothetical protein [Chitinispirillaceae bacterium]
MAYNPRSLLVFFKRSESYRYGFIASILLSLAAKVLGFFTTILTAFLFGSTTETDLFFFSMASAGILTSFLINLDGTTFIPKYMKLRDNGNVGKANDLIRFVFTMYLTVTAVAGAAVALFPEEWMNLFSRFDTGTISLYRGIVRWTGPLVVILTLNFFLIDLMSSFRRFSLSMMSGLICSFINILTILVFHRTLGVQSVVVGTLAGGFFQCCFLLYCVLRLSGCPLLPIVWMIDRKTFRYLSLSQGAYLCSLFGSFIPLYLLSGYSAGIISAVGYGQRLVDLLSLLLVAQFSNVLGIKLNELHISHEVEKLRTSFFTIGKTALFFAVPAVVLMSVLCFEVVSVIFLRGEFHFDEAMEASRFTRVLVFLIPFLILNTMVARLFMATEKIDKSFGFQSTMGILMGIICMVGIHFFGPHAYPYAMLTAYAINLITVKFILDRFFPWMKGFYRLLVYGVFMAVINGMIVPMDLLIKNLMADRHPLVIIISVVLFHLAVFGGIAYLWRLFKPFTSTIDKKSH